MIKPSDNHVLVKPEDIPQMEIRGGIFILKEKISKYRKGIVIEVGDNVDSLKIGDIVTFNTLHQPQTEDGDYIVNTDINDCFIVCKHN